MHIIQCPHCLTHTSRKSSLLVPFEIFPIGFHALFHSFWPRFEALWKFFFCDGFKVSRHAGLYILDSFENPFQLWKKKEITRGLVRRIRWMMQRGDFFRDQELLRWGLCGQEHCRDARSKFFLPRKLFVFDKFCCQTSQNFLVKVLVNCLPLRNKLMMHHSLMIKEEDHFHLWTLHAGFFWSGRGHTFVLTTLSFCFRIILKDPWIICDDVFQKFFVCFHLLKDVSACIQSLSFLLLNQEPWHHFGTDLPHAQSVNQNGVDRFLVHPNFVGNDANC